MKVFKKFKWSDKPEVKHEQVLIASIIGAAILAYFRLRPYFDVTGNVSTANIHNEHAQTPKNFISQFLLGGNGNSNKQNHNQSRSGGGYSGASHSTSGSHAGSVIERPLFDGLEVTLRGVLLNSLSSLATENPVELTLSGLVPSEVTQGMDDSEVRGGTLKGRFSANLDKKRINLSFSELVTKDGRSLSVTGYAFDPESKTIGIEGDYSSGFGKRILGAVVDQAIITGDQIGMAKLITNSSDSPGAAEIQMAAVATNQQATNEIANETTKDLRNTPAELSLNAGTPIIVKIRVTNQGRTP